MKSQGTGCVGMLLSQWAERALLEQVAVNSRLAIRLNRRILVHRTHDETRCLFTMSVYTPMNCSSSDKKDDFFPKLQSYSFYPGHRLRWLWHLLRMRPDRTATNGLGWTHRRGGQLV